MAFTRTRGYLDGRHPVLAERGRPAAIGPPPSSRHSYCPVAFVLQRGFDVSTTSRSRAPVNGRPWTRPGARSPLSGGNPQPLFCVGALLDPHAPLLPEPFRSRYRPDRISAKSQRWTSSWDAWSRRSSRPRLPIAIVVAADHGEGLGDQARCTRQPPHQSTMHAPLIVVGPGVAPGTIDAPVSTRRISTRCWDWAGIDPALSLQRAEQAWSWRGDEAVSYGWQPQTMGGCGQFKAIQAGTLRLTTWADPKESKNLGAGANLPAGMRNARRLPALSLRLHRTPENLDEDARRRLASLGYIGATASGSPPRCARPADMVRLFDVIDKASGLFVQERTPTPSRCSSGYSPTIRQSRRDARLATSHSLLGHEPQASPRPRASHRPQSTDVRTYLALHYARGRDWQQAAPPSSRSSPRRPNGWSRSTRSRPSASARAIAPRRLRCARRRGRCGLSALPNWSTSAISR